MTKTIFKLTWAASGFIPKEERYFGPDYFNDAVTRFSECVVMMDRAVVVSAAYAALERLPDSIFPEGAHILGWTKTSDEHPTREGATSSSEVL